jgi:FKBP-type peptidyl-prolyl cis-trans isomerase (trigger factor)
MEQRTSCPVLQCEVKEESPFCAKLIITVPSLYVSVVYNHAVEQQRARTIAPGFGLGKVPHAYVEQNFRTSLTGHLKDFLLNFFVCSFVLQEIRRRKMVTISDPVLHSFTLDPQKDAVFTFEVPVFSQLILNEWKHFPFNSPKRKNYKDLDRQVESFIQEEQERMEHTQSTIDIGDWVRFSISIVNHTLSLLIPSHQEIMWIKIGDEEVDIPLGSLFMGRAIGEVFYSSNNELQYHFSPSVDAHHIFRIEILDVLFYSFFCIEQFKKCFKLKTQKEVHQKFIEVFSYRNNISQRRAMAEESLRLLLSKHRFTVPSHLIAMQQKEILNNMRFNPDYHVYRAQKDFKQSVRQLAEKQSKEKIILDMVAYQDNIIATDQDIKWMHNLSNRPRTKGFLFFDPYSTKIKGQEVPISEETLKFICLREKTLNYIIYHLTRR